MQKLSNELNDDKNDARSNEDQDASIRVKEHGYWKEVEELERQADMQSKEMELGSCIGFVSRLVDLFKNTVVLPELQSKHGWYDARGRQSKRNKGTKENSLLDDRVEEIVLSKGLTKEQWEPLLCLKLIADDTSEMNHVSRSHLKKVHDMALRLFEKDEQAVLFALIDAIKKYMPESHYTDR